MELLAEVTLHSVGNRDEQFIQCDLYYFDPRLLSRLPEVIANMECVPVRFAYLGVPGFVLKGQPVWLDCGYDLEGNELYSVKWYKDNVEFYRYLPSDNPSAQMYKLDGVHLDNLTTLLPSELKILYHDEVHTPHSPESHSTPMY
ncbi:uncharacterized protein TNCV_3188281 [Trichonephila clavipes]|nr:uncharacterized protein TNCV_3188281 [Trichonephila clavipes]